MSIDFIPSTDTVSVHPHRALDELRGTIAGQVYAPGDPDWDRVRTPWALAIEQTPLAVVEVADAEDVRRAVRWAVRHDRQVTAQPVGHGASNSFDKVLLLRTRALNSIAIDLSAGTATVGAGVKAGELLAALDGTGLTFLAGSNPDPSVVGMTITGGMSWFGRKYGLAANAVVSFELVDAYGRLRRVSPTEDPELFWAVRGGGGDFGIITALELRLMPGSQLYGGRLLWPVEQMPEVLRAFRTVTATAPDELTLWYHTYQFPPAPEVPEPLRGQAFASVAVGYLGNAETAEELLTPFRAIPGIVMDLLGPVAMKDLASIAAEPTEPMPSLEHSMFLDDLSDKVISRLTSIAGVGSRSPLAILQIRHLGGAFRQVRADHGACGHLDEPYLMFAMGVPVVPELALALAATFGRLDEELSGHTNGRTVPNFLGAHGDVKRTWSPETRARLSKIKFDVDPMSTIRSNRPVHA